ncbi:hypothetical protein Sjap_017883 [Stephania japonica]|uniref:Uncharacterized protein n=1 Tax=Stephania japonica TaxID=461633 RepID=A0AAP0NK04_9MAGN
MFARNSTIAASSQYSSSWTFAVQQEPIKACDLFSGFHHFSNVCPFDYWSNSSPQPDKYSSMRNRPSRDKIRFLLETEQDMYLNEQELDQWIQEKNQEAEDEIKLIIQKRSAKTMSAIPLKSVEVKDEEYMSNYEESEGELEVSQSEPEIIMTQTYEEEAEKEIEVTLTRPKELQQESKDNQSFVLVNPPTLPYIFDDFEMEVDVKERSKPLCTTDTFVLDDLDITDSYVLKVPDKLPFLNKGVSFHCPMLKERVSFLDTLYWKASCELELIIVLGKIDDHDMPLNLDLVLWNHRLRTKLARYIMNSRALITLGKMMIFVHE